MFGNSENGEEKVGTFRGGLPSWSKRVRKYRIWKQEVLVLNSMLCFKVLSLDQCFTT